MPCGKSRRNPTAHAKPSPRIWLSRRSRAETRCASPLDTSPPGPRSDPRDGAAGAQFPGSSDPPGLDRQMFALKDASNAIADGWNSRCRTSRRPRCASLRWSTPPGFARPDRAALDHHRQRPPDRQPLNTADSERLLLLNGRIDQLLDQISEALSNDAMPEAIRGQNDIIRDGFTKPFAAPQHRTCARPHRQGPLLRRLRDLPQPHAAHLRHDRRSARCQL